MPLITYTTVCTSKTLIARDVYEMRFTKPEGFVFKAGQFILFDVPLVDAPTDLQTRALSIASTPDERELLFVVKLVPGGRLSRWIAEVLREGTSVTFKGPFGNFILKSAPEQSLLFIATGAGIAPFRPMILSALQENPDQKIGVIFGVHSEEDLFWKEWLEQTSKKHPNVFHHLTLTHPSASWNGHHGRVQVVAPVVMKNDFRGVSLYVCGNPDMTTDVKKLALSEWGMEKKDLHVEGYI